jgi:hypothetical protein
LSNRRKPSCKFQGELTLRVLMQFLHNNILYTERCSFCCFWEIFLRLFLWRGDELLYRC